MTRLQRTYIEIGILLFACGLAFFLRTYATYRDLIFAYDQGRDALMMRNIRDGDLKLIGPVTGLDGVYLGPFWYYLIFPFYLLGGGNPLYPAVEMKLFSIGVVILLYLWGKKAQLTWFGLLAGIIYAGSFSNILFARWLSNPVPLPFFAVLGFYLLWHALENKHVWLYGIAGIVFGLCLQLEAANAIWFLPTIASILAHEIYLQRKSAGIWAASLKRGSISLLGFFITTVPQIIYELKNNFLITRNLLHAFQVTHESSVWANLPSRFSLLLDLYGRGLFEKHGWLFVYVCILLCCSVVTFREKLFAHRHWRMLFYWFFVPLCFHLLYTGNHGNFWDYYLIAQQVSLILLLSVTAGILSRIHRWRSLVLGVTLCLSIASLGTNLWKWREMIPPYAGRFSLEQQVNAIYWMQAQANGERFGAWVYTPSAQDDPYRYLFSWVGSKTGVYPEEHVEQAPIIFLVVEDDPIYWLRRREWIQERERFGTTITRERFGSITVYKLKNTFMQQRVQ